MTTIDTSNSSLIPDTDDLKNSIKREINRILLNTPIETSNIVEKNG